MSSDSQKEAVLTFFNKFESSDIEGVLSTMHDDVTWRVMGQQGGLPISGEMDKHGIVELMSTVRESVEQRLHMSVLAWTIDGNRLAVEVESHAKLKNGRLYNNLYHFLFVMDEGKIKSIKEYGDTEQVKRIFID